jgi:Zn-dependent protease with chaperone function
MHSTAEPTASLVAARWFDGRSSQAQPVLIGFEPGAGGPRLKLHRLSPDAEVIELSADQVGWPERWSTRRAPLRLVVDLRQHGSLEVDDVAGWEAARQGAGVAVSLAERMQTRWRVFAGVLLLAAFALFGFYRWGTPWVATQITRQVPLDWETDLAQRALKDLDEELLKPSKLPAFRQAQLRERFDTLARQVDPRLHRYSGYAPRLSLSFRSGLGPNAFALPGGAIVMTDGLVEEAERQRLGDEALVGVLAHEIGHVVHRHTTRMLVEQAVLNAGLGLALGDVSTILSMGASALTGLAYSRNHETEADCFAVALMRQGQLPTAPMADLLLGIEAARDEKTASRKSGKPDAPAKTGSAGALAELFSSHPATALRATQLKQNPLEGC